MSRAPPPAPTATSTAPTSSSCRCCSMRPWWMTACAVRAALLWLLMGVCGMSCTCYLLLPLRRQPMWGALAGTGMQRCLPSNASLCMCAQGHAVHDRASHTSVYGTTMPGAVPAARSLVLPKSTPARHCSLVPPADCCDGSDEPAGRCPDTCYDKGMESLADLQAQVSLVVAGASLLLR